MHNRHAQIAMHNRRVIINPHAKKIVTTGKSERNNYEQKVFTIRERKKSLCLFSSLSLIFNSKFGNKIVYEMSSDALN